jgi:hypothetical protein
VVENIGGYVFDHTTRNASRWNTLQADERGPFFVSTLNAPRKDEFLRYVRQHMEKSPGCNPLDGREHMIGEIARWIGVRALAVRFVSLGVLLGVFELASPRESRPGETDPEMCLLGERFRAKGTHPGAAIKGSARQAGAARDWRRRGPRRPRSIRRRWA